LDTIETRVNNEEGITIVP